MWEGRFAAIGCLAWTLYAQNQRPTVMLELHNLQAPFAAINSARAAATQIYAGIGIQLEWSTKAAPADGAVSIELDTPTPNRFHPEAMAYASPYGTSEPRIHVFLDRVQRSGGALPPGVLLGYVIAHELGHVLEGIDRHSTEGIMQAHWEHVQLEQMAMRQFPFSPEDAELIRAGVARRMATVSARMAISR